MAEPAQTRIINIPNGYTARQRVQIGNDIVRRIQERTALGLDATNQLFAGYSRNYEKSGTVNLRLSGDMLNGLTLISHGPGFVRIGFSSTDANDKAAYIQAPRGQKLGRQPARQFVGISQADLNVILDRYPLI